MRVACVGDSLTNKYPKLLQRMLRGADVRGYSAGCTSVLAEPRCAARGCGCGSFLATDAYDDALAWQPDVFVVQFGTSDAGRPWVPGWADEFERGFVDFVEMLNASIVVVRPPPLFGDGGRNTTTTNVLYKESFANIVDKTHALFVDGFSALEGRRRDFGDDGVHPTCSGAAKLAEAVRNVLVENFQGVEKRRANHLCPVNFANKCANGHYECVHVGFAAALVFLSLVVCAIVVLLAPECAPEEAEK
ncbi:SGNH hydrolase-type esterase domain-containing protein [Pelagophyceae sp. CCMP2097]|nr:SGNH hydrolase-type esterase domain-containing protein [Pelagophyceae sp. CCMP2097]